MSAKYFCEFTFHMLGHPHDGHRCLTEVPNIMTARDGFWVSEGLHLATGEKDTAFWIPPSAIRCVKKVRE